MMKRLSLLSLFLSLACACGPTEDSNNQQETDDYDVTEPGPLMRPGVNCLSCHADGFGEEAPPWSLGGTVFPAADSDEFDGVEGVVLNITDANGVEVELTTNAAGNFYTPEALEPPFAVSLTHDGRTVEMPFDAPQGSCNACHNATSPVGGALGYIRIPQ